MSQATLYWKVRSSVETFASIWGRQKKGRQPVARPPDEDIEMQDVHMIESNRLSNRQSIRF